MADKPPFGVRRVRAANPSPLTLDGTNTYVAWGWVIDPGPALGEHLDAVLALGPFEGVLLTHSHSDHSAGAEELARRAGGLDVVLPRGDGKVGPFKALATPGHAPDHVCLVREGVCFTGDTVLGSGSVFIGPGEGSLGAYLDSLRRLRSLPLEALCPGHGPFVHDPAAKLDEYIAHRLEREAGLMEALEAGVWDPDALLDRAWSDTPADLRFPALLTMRAHLEKLEAEGRLPPGSSAKSLAPLPPGTLEALARYS